MKPALQLSHATPVNTWVQVMGKKKKKTCARAKVFVRSITPFFVVNKSVR